MRYFPVSILTLILRDISVLKLTARFSGSEIDTDSARFSGFEIDCVVLRF